MPTGDAKKKKCLIPVVVPPRLIARAKSQRASSVEVSQPPFLETSPLPPTPEVKRLGEDGVAYTKAQFDEFYGDLDTALHFWITAGSVAVAAAHKPLERFSPGSIVRVLPDSRPGVRPEHAEGLLSANIHAEEVHEDGEVFCIVSPTGSKRRRKVSANLIVEASLDTIMYERSGS